MTAANVIAISRALRVSSSPVHTSLADELTQVRDTFFFLLLACTVLVALGVALEEVDHWLPSGRPRLNMFDGSFSPSRWIEWKSRLARLGWVLILVGVIGEGIFEGGTSWADSKLQEFNTTVLRNAEAQTGNAANAADRANRSADAIAAKERKIETDEQSLERKSAKLDVRLSTATQQLDDVEKKRAELEKSLTNLAVCFSPRVIHYMMFTVPGKGMFSTIDPLRLLASEVSEVFIEYAANDAESRRAARSLAAALKATGWHLSGEPKPVQEIDDGVKVQPSMTAQANWDAAEKLVDFLHSFNWQADTDFPLDDQGVVIRDPAIMPPKSMRIRVGLYPAVMYVTPAGVEPFAEAYSATKQQNEEHNKETRAKIDADLEKRLSRFPPEEAAQYRASIQRQRKLDEEREKRRTGPCHTLSPLPQFSF